MILNDLHCSLLQSYTILRNSSQNDEVMESNLGYVKFLRNLSSSYLVNVLRLLSNNTSHGSQKLFVR